MIICKYENCTGCYACSNICPTNCIEFSANEDGHIVPKIDSSRCIECGLCQKTCPANQSPTLNRPQNAFAAWSLDEDDRSTSTSGGAASVFSTEVINLGGVVYGATQVNNGNLKHERINDIGDLCKIKGSKYVQSHIENSYKRVKEDLLDNITVLFIGTPCQIAGLKSFLGKDYYNLITVDIICHGVPAQKMLQDHLFDKIGHLNFDSISFRDKDGYHIKILKKENILYEESLYRDYYYMGFMKSLFYRESCYSCIYACQNRISDITIGDFWGLGKEKPFLHPMEGGISLILPITDKGKAFLESCKSNLFLEEREITEAVNGNSQLMSPSKKHKNLDKFKKMYKKYGFEIAAIKCLKTQRIKYFILENLRKIKEV